jgi:quinol monooxygenase YgiN
MISIRKQVTSDTSLVACVLSLGFVFAIAAGAPARAQAENGADAVYGVTTLDVAPGADHQAVAILKHYGEVARKQPGNMGVDVLQEIGFPNRFVIYEAWKDHAAYDTNETAAPTAELRDKLKPIAGAPFDRRDYKVISVGPAKPAKGSGAVYMQVHLDVFPPGVVPTLAASKQVAEAARKGDGNLRYDVVQSIKAPTIHMTLFAAWQSREEFDEYESSGYGRRFRAIVGPLLGSPFDDRLYTLVD